MSSNNSESNPETAAPSLPVTASIPDYPGIVRFLLEPFLEDTHSIRLDCERLKGSDKVWVRLAFAESERGRVFGRGGRNIQAIRTVLGATAALAGQQVYLDIYGEAPAHESDESAAGHEGGASRGHRQRRRPSRRRQRDEKPTS